jgi:hypothetical protein
MFKNHTQAPAAMNSHAATEWRSADRLDSLVGSETQDLLHPQHHAQEARESWRCV